MRKVRLQGLLFVFFISELQAVAKSAEEKFVLREGQTFNVNCYFSIWQYLNSRKAWQRLTDGGERLTLALIDKASGGPSQVQVGRCFLEEISDEGILHVQMTNLRVEDSGLYECVIDQHPKAKDHPILFHHPVRLVVTKDPSDTTASDKTPSQKTTQVPIRPRVTTKTQSILHTSPRTVTQFLPMVTASLSSPGLGVTPTQRTDVIRISLISIVVFVVCGILSKSLVFTVLLVVTQRSFGSRPVNPQK